MGKGLVPVTEVEAKQSLLILRRYLEQNGLGKKPFHWKSYILRDCTIGDYIMRVVYQHSKRIFTNKLYKIVSGYSYHKGYAGYNGDTTWIIIDENGEEYKIDSVNFGHRWVYFRQKEVERKSTPILPKEIAEYNTALAKKIKK